MTTIDKSSWPKFEPLPVHLGAPAKSYPAKYTTGNFYAGHFAYSAHEAQGAAGQADGITETPASTRYVGRDPRGALAAAVAAANELYKPADGTDHWKIPAANTLIGLYESKGFYTIAPLWEVPTGGTDWMTITANVNPTRAKNPDFRFDFHDTKLDAVVAPDGWIHPDSKLSAKDPLTPLVLDEPKV